MQGMTHQWSATDAAHTWNLSRQETDSCLDSLTCIKAPRGVLLMCCSSPGPLRGPRWLPAAPLSWFVRRDGLCRLLILQLNWCADHFVSVHRHLSTVPKQPGPISAQCRECSGRSPGWAGRFPCERATPQQLEALLSRSTRTNAHVR